MAEIGHTPGEWIAIPPKAKGKHWKVGSKGKFGGKGPMAAVDCVLLVAHIDNGATGDSLETEEFNAKLIAAAPDLLESLQWLLSVFESHEKPSPDELETLLEKAHAALEKAGHD